MANDENLKKGEATRFRAGEEQVRTARRGGIASGVARRKKFASRKFLKEVLALEPKKTPDMIKTIEKLGGDPNCVLTVEDVGVLALIKKYWAGDLRAYDMIHEYLGEDAHTILEEKRIKMQQQAVAQITHSDGFMEALGATVGEVFDDGGDTPDTVEDE